MLATIKGIPRLYNNIVDGKKVKFHQYYFLSADNVIIEARGQQRCVPSLNVCGGGVSYLRSSPPQLVDVFSNLLSQLLLCYVH